MQSCGPSERCVSIAPWLLLPCHARITALSWPHAAVQAAVQHGGRWGLRGATLYVTLEPCAMCAGAILLARVGTVVYGARSTLLGADGSWASLFPRPALQQGAEGTAACSCDEPQAAGLPHAALRPHKTHPDLQVTPCTRRRGECRRMPPAEIAFRCVRACCPAGAQGRACRGVRRAHAAVLPGAAAGE